MTKYLAVVLAIGIFGITGCGVRMRIPIWPPSDSQVSEDEEARKAHFIFGQLAAENGDLATAIEELRPLAETGHVLAQGTLGSIYANGGRGVPQNDKEAVKGYRLAAEQGHVLAQYDLGVMYATARGVSQDDKEAVKWFRLAAEQRHVKAQYNLGVMYAIGAGVPQDNIQAYMWLSLAINEIPRARQIRDKVSAKMAPSEIAKAQRLVREWQVAKARN